MEGLDRGEVNLPQLTGWAGTVEDQLLSPRDARGRAAVHVRGAGRVPWRRHPRAGVSAARLHSAASSGADGRLRLRVRATAEVNAWILGSRHRPSPCCPEAQYQVAQPAAAPQQPVVTVDLWNARFIFQILWLLNVGIKSIKYILTFLLWLWIINSQSDLNE